MLSKAIEKNRSFEFLLAQKLKQHGGNAKIALNSVIAGASKSDRVMSLYSKAGKYGGPVMIVAGIWGSLNRIKEAVEGTSADGVVEAGVKEYFSWSSALVGAELGGIAGAAITEAVPILGPYPSIILGFAGGIVGGILGEEAVEGLWSPTTDPGAVSMPEAVRIYDKF